MLHNMYRQVNRLVSFLPPSGCVYTVHYIHTSQRHRSAVHTTHLKMLEAYTHTHTQMAHNIIYTPGTMSTICVTPFRTGPDTTIENG